MADKKDAGAAFTGQEEGTSDRGDSKKPFLLIEAEPPSQSPSAAPARAEEGGASEPREEVPQSIREDVSEGTWERWRKIINGDPRVRNSFDIVGKKRALESIERMLRTRSGETLIARLVEILSPRSSKITIFFTKWIYFPPECVEKGGVAGCFRPAQPDNSSYKVYVELNQTEVFSFHWCDLVGNFTAPESIMAAILYHELAHIWYIHAHRGGVNGLIDTGHSGCEVDSRFRYKFRESLRDLADLEKWDLNRRSHGR